MTITFFSNIAHSCAHLLPAHLCCSCRGQRIVSGAAAPAPAQPDAAERGKGRRSQRERQLFLDALSILAAGLAGAHRHLAGWKRVGAALPVSSKYTLCVCARAACPVLRAGLAAVSVYAKSPQRQRTNLGCCICYGHLHSSSKQHSIAQLL
eukprot:717528-Pelagomonas_calceolata.AAC.3